MWFRPCIVYFWKLKISCGTFFFKIVENKLVIIVIQKIKLMTEEIKPYFPQIDFYFYFILFIYFVVFCSNEGTVKILKIGTP